MMGVRNESIPTAPSPERPPLAPHDPPDPAPQALAWRRALKVVDTQFAWTDHDRAQTGRGVRFVGQSRRVNNLELL